MIASHIVPVEETIEETILSAMYDTFLPLLQRKPQVAAQMASEIDAIARRYAEQHMVVRHRPTRYQKDEGE